jgi:hypothetical protein
MLLIKYKKTYLYKEMVYIKINDKDIPSFSEETIDEFRNRVAVKFKTLPSLMSVIKEGKVFFIENLVKETKLKSFSEFLKYIKDTYDFPRVLDIELILYTWILSNKEGDSEEFIGYKRLEDEIKQSVFLRNSLQDFDFLKFQDEKFKNEMKKKIKERKEELKKNVDKVDEIYKILELEKEQPHTEFKKQRYQAFLSTTLKDISLDYIFSIIVCNPIIPFCVFKNVCKIYKKTQHEFFENTEAVSESFSNKILLKINIKNDTFVDSIMFLKDGILTVEINVDTEQQFDFKKHISSLFDSSDIFEFVDTKDTQDHNIHGVVFFPQQKVDKYILSDLIMNNPIVSKFLCVDESIKASTKKTGLLLKYRGGELNGIDIDSSSNVICKKVTETDTELRGYDRKLFSIGSYYIRIRLSRFKNMEKTNAFISLISKVLSFYHKFEKDIITEYRAFLGKSFIVNEEDDEDEQKETIETLAPSIFVSKYRKVCIEARHPVILKESEITTLKEYEDYIRFPKEEMPEQFCYRCNSEEYPFIGLFLNKSLSNSDKFEYIPCCYKNRKNNNNNIDIYYGITEKEKDKKQQGILSTLHHLLPSNHYGELPKNIIKLLSTLYTDTVYTYYRVGVKSSKHSFLECVLKATGEKKQKIKLFEIASQENPDLTLDEMEKMFKDENVYMDPRRWIRLLENTYKCNIQVFSRLFKNENAELVIPYHKGPYLRYKPIYDQTLFILENQDSRTREIRCELIAIKEDDKYIYLFDKMSPIFPKQIYLGDKKISIKEQEYPPQDIEYKFQILDSFKKIQCLVTEDDVYLMCNPLPPLSLPILSIEENPNIFQSNRKAVEKLIKRSLNKKETAVSFGIFKIYLDETMDETPLIDMFLINKKIATILGEFFIYMFSIFIKDKDESSIEIIKYIKSFIDDKVIIKKSSFKLIPSSVIDLEIMKKCNYLSKDGKIIVSSNNLLKRLICLLRMRLINKWNEVRFYYTQKNLLNFYDSISDYIPSLNPLNILILSNQLKKLSPISQIIYTEFQQKQKYYLKFNGKLFIVDTLEEDIDPYLFPIIYDENFKILKENNPGVSEPKCLLFYTKKTIDENKKKIVKNMYQQMTLL